MDTAPYSLVTLVLFIGNLAVLYIAAVGDWETASGQDELIMATTSTKTESTVEVNSNNMSDILIYRHLKTDIKLTEEPPLTQRAQ